MESLTYIDSADYDFGVSHMDSPQTPLTLDSDENGKGFATHGESLRCVMRRSFVTSQTFLPSRPSGGHHGGSASRRIRAGGWGRKHNHLLPFAPRLEPRRPAVVERAASVAAEISRLSRSGVFFLSCAPLWRLDAPLRPRARTPSCMCLFALLSACAHEYRLLPRRFHPPQRRPSFLIGTTPCCPAAGLHRMAFA